MYQFILPGLMADLRPDLSEAPSRSSEILACAFAVPASQKSASELAMRFPKHHVVDDTLKHVDGRHAIALMTTLPSDVERCRLTIASRNAGLSSRRDAVTDVPAMKPPF